MNLTPLKQVTNVINGVIHIQLPKDFDAKRVELTIVPLDDKAAPLSGFQQFLLDSPEMTDEEFDNLQAKKEHFRQWK